jgi:glutaconate CoA-transferase, subunit B
VKRNSAKGAAMEFTSNEMMTIAAARALRNDDVCFVGIGAPSAACNVARLTHAPDITLIYESGTIGVAPHVLPLSIGDGELCETAVTTVSVPEMFRYWLQGGRITVGFLGAAQLDRFGNINTTVIGDYARPKVRLPGGGGAPEIAISCQQIFITMKQSQRGFVEKIDFFTSLGHGKGGDDRLRNYGVATEGPTLLITDLAIWKPDPQTKEFTVSSLHPGVTAEMVRESCGWQARFADRLTETPAPSEIELATLRDLKARTDAAHAGKAGAARRGSRDG